MMLLKKSKFLILNHQWGKTLYTGRNVPIGDNQVGHRLFELEGM